MSFLNRMSSRRQYSSGGSGGGFSANTAFSGGWSGEVATSLVAEKASAFSINAKTRFGVVGDDSTNNNTALLALRDYMNLDKTRHYEVFVPPGTYQYTNNRWLYGVGSVRITADGVTFKNVSASASNREAKPLNMPDIFETYGDQDWPGDLSFYPGYKFNTAAAGLLTVTLTTLADYTNFSPGLRVLLHGFDQQWGGYPPNMRFFEWNEVVSVNSGTGFITLKYPLQWAYDQNWRDTTGYAGGAAFGKPRITPLVRSGYYYPRFIEFVGATFARNPNSGSNQDNGLQHPAEVLKFTRCTYAGSTVPSGNRIVENTECTFNDGEPDKIVHKALYSKTKFIAAGYESGGTGCDYIKYEDCFFFKQYLALAPKQLELVRNTFVAPDGYSGSLIGNNFGKYPIRRLVLTDNKVIHDGALGSLVGTSRYSMNAMTGGSNNQIRIVDDATNRDGVIQNLAPGSIVQRSDAAFGGVVTNITYNGTSFLLDGTWGGTIADNQTWYFWDIQEIEEKGTIYVGGVKRALSETRPKQIGPTRENGRIRTIRLEYPWNWPGTGEAHDIFGNIIAVRCAVTKAYSGPQGAGGVTINGNKIGGGSDGFVNGLNLLSTGYAETRIGYKTAAGSPADINPATFYSSINVYYSNVGTAMNGRADQQAQMVIELDVIC